MIEDLDGYFRERGLYDERALAEHCERNLVRASRSSRYPGLALLHYTERAVFERAWTPFALSCRGLLVDLVEKRLLAVPFFKFFNLGEPQAPPLADLERAGAFEATEKLDGSLGIAFRDPRSGRFAVTTKGSLDSEHGEWATALFPEGLKIPELLRTHTIMFEIIADRFRVVVDYRAKGYGEGLYLLGVRENATQRLLDRPELEAFAARHGLEPCRAYRFSSLAEVVRTAQGLPHSDEGFVLRFGGDVMVKLKSPEYLRVHRFVFGLSEKHLLECLAEGQDGKIEENLPCVAEEYRAAVEASLARYRCDAAEFLEALRGSFAAAPRGDRKTFAQWALATAPRGQAPFLFKMLDGEAPAERDVYRFFLREGRYRSEAEAGFRKPLEDL